MASGSPNVTRSVSSSEEVGEEERRGEDGRRKEELIGRIIELQNTLHDLTQRVNSVKEENTKLKSENEVLNKYIENLMATSGSFKASDGKK